jgi:hypothetical protein
MYKLLLFNKIKSFFMKSVKLIVLIAFCQVFFKNATAQIVINANGESKLGYEWPNNDYNNEVTHEFFGITDASYRPGCKISLGDYGSGLSGGANVFIAEAYGWDSDALE